MRYWEIINEALNMELTIKNWDHQLRDRLAKDRSAQQMNYKTMTPQELITWFADWDPTKAKKYLINWILPRYVFGGINQIEDLEGVRDDLADFDRYKHLMLQKDIIKIKTAAELATMVRETLKPEGGEETRNGVIPPQEIQAAKKESILVFEDDANIVVIPLTQRAAGYWGRNSNWCTAYGYKWGGYPDRTSWFDRYNSDEQRLLIVINKQNLEAEELNYQCHYDGEFGEDSQVMDLSDTDCTTQNNLEQVFKKLSDDQIGIIVNNCLGQYDIEPNQTNRFDIHSTSSITARSRLVAKNIKFFDLIADHANSTAKNIWKIIVGQRYFELDYYDESLSNIIAQHVPAKLERKLTEYLSKKYDDEFDESEESIADFLKSHDEDEIIQCLINDNATAQRNGVEAAMWNAFDEAVSEAGIQMADPGNYDGLCTIRGPSVLEFLSYPRFNPGLDLEHLIYVSEPQYGWEGYGDTVWDDSELESLLK